MHWITSVVFLAAAPISSGGYSFAVGIYTYGHIIFSGEHRILWHYQFNADTTIVFVALGLPWLDKPLSEFSFFSRKKMLYTVPFIFAFGNVRILVFAGKTYQEGKIPRWWWPIVATIILFASGLYWAGIQIFMSRTIGDLVGLSIRIEKKGERRSMVRGPEEILADRMDGSGRQVIVETSGWLASCHKALRILGNRTGKYLF